MLPRADDDGGAELGHGDAGLAEGVTRLLARAEVLGEPGCRVTEAAEVDDAADASVAGGLGEGAGRADVRFAEAVAPGHAVHEVVGAIDAL